MALTKLESDRLDARTAPGVSWLGGETYGAPESTTYDRAVEHISRHPVSSVADGVMAAGLILGAARLLPQAANLCRHERLIAQAVARLGSESAQVEQALPFYSRGATLETSNGFTSTLQAGEKVSRPAPLNFDALRPPLLADNTVAIPTFERSVAHPHPRGSIQIVAADTYAARIYQQSLQSVGRISREDGGAGTGFIVDSERGLVATADHVVKNPQQKMWLQLSGESLPVRLVSHDVRSDVALLKVDTSLKDRPAVGLFTENNVMGSEAYLAGFPARTPELALTHGKVTNWWLTPRPRELREALLPDGRGRVITARINHTAQSYNGNSGGPLMLKDGSAVGLHTNGNLDKRQATASIHIRALLNDKELRPSQVGWLDRWTMASVDPFAKAMPPRA